MTVGFDTTTDQFVVHPEDCPHCEQPLYFSGCDAPGCSSWGCQDCGTGCDLDFVDDGDCATALAEEDPNDRQERQNRERAAFGLPPLTNGEAVTS